MTAAAKPSAKQIRDSVEAPTMWQGATAAVPKVAPAAQRREAA